jgi:hypothetical protein
MLINLARSAQEGGRPRPTTARTPDAPSEHRDPRNTRRSGRPRQRQGRADTAAAGSRLDSGSSAMSAAIIAGRQVSGPRGVAHAAVDTGSGPSAAGPLPASWPCHGAHRRDRPVASRLDDLAVGETDAPQPLHVRYIRYGRHRHPGFKLLVQAQSSRERTVRVHDVNRRLSVEPGMGDLDVAAWRQVDHLHEVVLRGRGQPDRPMHRTRTWRRRCCHPRA